jgi:hypothetical protein
MSAVCFGDFGLMHSWRVPLPQIFAGFEQPLGIRDVGGICKGYAERRRTDTDRDGNQREWKWLIRKNGW